MSREDRDIVLEGPMPVSLAGINSEDRAMDFLNLLTWVKAVEYRNQNEFIRDAIDACSTEFAKFGYLPSEGDSFSDVWSALAAFRQSERDRVYERDTAAQDERAELGRQERERFRLHYDVEQLVSGLLGYGVQQGIVISVLHGNADAINTAASRVRTVARERESAGLASANSHSRLLTLLRRSNAPGSNEAQQFLREWPQSAAREQPARAPSGLQPPATSSGVTRLGRAVDLPEQGDDGIAAIQAITEESARAGDTSLHPRTDQWMRQLARNTFKRSLFAMLSEYSGDVTYVCSLFAGYLIDYGISNGDRTPDNLSRTVAEAMISEAASITSTPIDMLIPPRLRSGWSSAAEQGNEHAGQTETTPANQLSEPLGPGSLLGRDSGEPDDSTTTGPANPSIIRL